MMHMAYDPPCQAPCTYTAGIAYTGVVCIHSNYNPLKQSINEWATTHAATAHTVAHEIGHNLGMLHDFLGPHAAAGCDKTGVMSYGDPVNKWSTCSASDFRMHYGMYKSSWCMPSKQIKNYLISLKHSLLFQSYFTCLWTCDRRTLL